MVWSPVQIRSVASVTALLREIISQETPAPSRPRLDGPLVTTLVATSLETADVLLASAGIRIRVESDRDAVGSAAKTVTQQSRRRRSKGKAVNDQVDTGWTAQRQSAEGRWVGYGSGFFALGLLTGGRPNIGDPSWAPLLGDVGLDELEVSSWERVERTTWVIHDGDGLVFIEVVLDEERHLGTQVERTELRLMGFETSTEALRLDIGDRLSELVKAQAIQPPPVSLEAVHPAIQPTQLGRIDAPGQEPLVDEPDELTEPVLRDSRVEPLTNRNGRNTLVVHRFTRAALDIALFLDTYEENRSTNLQRSVSSELMLITAAGDALLRALPSAGRSLEPSQKWLRDLQTAQQRQGDLTWAAKRLSRIRRGQSEELQLLVDNLRAQILSVAEERASELNWLVEQHCSEQSLALREFVMASVNVRSEDVGLLTFPMVLGDLQKAATAWLDNGSFFAPHKTHPGQVAREKVVSESTKKLTKSPVNVPEKHFVNKRSRRLENAAFAFVQIGPLLLDQHGLGPKGANKLFRMAVQISEDFVWLRRRTALISAVRTQSTFVQAQPAAWLDLGGELRATELRLGTRRVLTAQRVSDLERALAVWTSESIE
jgi:hypothetical protein